MAEAHQTILVGLFFAIAMLYSSVGHGGATAYLAVMALLGFVPQEMRPTALTLNVLVSLVAWGNFLVAGHFSWRRAYPFVLASVPAAFLGGLVHFSEPLYNVLLGAGLMGAAFRIWIAARFATDVTIGKPPLIASFFLGAAIGFISGGIGIGGGVFLSPILLIAGWASIREAAAISAFFILANSLAGLGGIGLSGFLSHEFIWPPVLGAFAGGIAGSYFGANRVPESRLNHALAFVLVLASSKLLLKAF